MSENAQIKPGDVVCLKADKDKQSPDRFTVGNSQTGNRFLIHWYTGEDLKTAQVDGRALHKLE